MKCYTIGHSNHSIEHFFSLLRKHNINTIVDVRSSPYSNYVTHFNKDQIQLSAKQNGFDYIYLGDSLGARQTEKGLLFPDGKVDFLKVRQTDRYQNGVNKVADLISKGSAVAIMCAEKDPYDCHRFVLVSYSLHVLGIAVEHILEDGSIITNDQLERRLKKEYAQKSIEDMFAPQNSIDQLYEKRNREIAFQAFK